MFIDELDRCRPDFSLGIVEILKHFFRANNIHFILVTNRNHLQASVEQRYGRGAASSEYLEKFYDFIVFFENTYDRHTEGSIGRFVDLCMSEVLPPNTEDARNVHDYVRDISLAFRLSLRQVQQLAANVALAYAAAREREFRPAILISFLVTLKTLSPTLFQKARNNTLAWEEFAEFVRAGQWDRFDIDRIIKVFRFHLQKNIDANDSQWQGYGEYTWRYNIERERVIPYLATEVLDRFAVPFSKPHGQMPE